MAASGFGYAAEQDGMGTIADINVTPLVDIVLVLLIIMMVAAPIIANNPSIKLDPPKAKTGEQTSKSPITVSMTPKKDGTSGYLLFLNEKPTDEANLVSVIQKEAQKDPEVQAIISADKGISYGDVMHILDLVKGAGVHKFAMITDGR